MPAPYTTIASVRNTAAHLAAVSDATLTLIMSDAALEVDGLELIEKYQGELYKEKLTRYLTIHLATLKPQEVVKEKLDVLERTYKSETGLSGLSATVYGQEYERMVKEYTASPDHNKVVFF
ncbi:hypothetical protein AWH48_12050 [Domibacillus aminovorans]|uniref:Uncharacterized protein n=1 Tax=Domibacillus aminovorans TaxID=29332 RepID=A0A177KIY5_9BACI|nr:DUF4054 domain-containing protein [Domibacillus aminovorans]OAH53084.1 hypothetical protein AWH48_12050 [Domibacillus aminovorans]